LAHYEEALRLKPADYPEAHNNLAIALARSGRDAEALTHLAAAVGLSPAYAEAHFNLGLVLTRLGRVGEAIGAFDQALRLDPRFSRAHEARAYALQIAGREREAAAEMEIVTGLKSASREAGKN
jgi:tetratricopeptide (TPR) repeat protein